MARKHTRIVEESTTGFRMPESTAILIGALSPSSPLPYRRVGKSAVNFDVNPGERTDVSVISTDDPDRENEVVLPGAIDWSSYNKVVPFAHKYEELPVGSCWWMRATPKGLTAKTHYATKPEDWGDAPWMPSAILHLMQQPVPTCTGKSIGFIPTKIRKPTAQEIAEHPEWGGKTIIAEAKGLEYSVTPIPINPEAEMLTVSKALRSGQLSPKVAELIRKAMNDSQPAHSFGSTHIRPPGHIAALHKSMRERVDRTHLAEGGREDDPHVTVKYGIKGSDPTEIANALQGQGPVKCVMGKTQHFPATADRKSDVVHVPVESEDLDRLHKIIGGAVDNENTTGDYKPHMTLAYVHGGKGKDYDGMDDADGLAFSADTVTFSDPDGNETDIALTGKKAILLATRKAVGASEDVNADGGYDSIVKPMPACPKCDSSDAMKAMDAPDTNDTDNADGYFTCDGCGVSYRRDSADGPLEVYVANDEQSGADPATKATPAPTSDSVVVNHAAINAAHSLIAAGRVSDTPWDASTIDRTPANAHWFAAVDNGKSEDQSSHWLYPFGSGGEVNRHAVSSGEGRAAANGCTGVAEALRGLSRAIQARDVPATDDARAKSVRQPFVSQATIEAAVEKQKSARRKSIAAMLASAVDDEWHRIVGTP